MKIKELEISNFRGIEYAKASALSDLVVIAGPNGSGKSCVLDAVRLIKSLYGGYQANEYSLWMGEFQISTRTDRWDMLKLLRHKDKPATIKIGVVVSEREIDYLHRNSAILMEEAAFKSLEPQVSIDEWRRIRQTGQHLAPDWIARLSRTTSTLINQLNDELARSMQIARITIETDGKVSKGSNVTLETVWRIYQPAQVGVIDYHGPHRNYARESVGGVNLNLQSQEEQQKQHALYNYGQKYANIKSEMAGEFVRDMLRQKGGGRRHSKQRTLVSTLQELFSTFFPGKQFLGAQADGHGGLKFPVQIGSTEHDINELSSGEKEILYGYLRLRKSAPRDSIILLDEPELHLNPKLLQGLPQFYESHIVQALDNQMWLVTHSDALLRETLATPRATVMHMQEAKVEPSDVNQLKRVEKDHDVEQAVMELVGDIAAYRPGGKIVIFEGKEAGFDVNMTARLFPQFDREMNFVGGGNRLGVERLQRALDLERASSRVKVYSIVDRDGREQVAGRGRRLQWDAYHIENYLLDARYIGQVLRDSTVDQAAPLDSPAIEEALLSIARHHIDRLVTIQLQAYVNKTLVDKIQVRTEGDQPISNILEHYARKSADDVKQVVGDELTGGKIREQEKLYRGRLEEALKSEEWKREFRGRDILKKFVGEYCQGIKYDRFRNMVVNRMRQERHEPPGMRTVLRQIAERN